MLKLKAIILKEAWLNEDLAKSCVDPRDELYRLQLVKELPSLLSKERSVMVCDDITAHSFFRIVFWLRRRREFHLSFGAVIRGFFKFIRDTFA